MAPPVASSWHYLLNAGCPLQWMAAGDGSGAGLEALPRDAAKQLQQERRAGGVQHLVDLLRQIEVGFCSRESP